MSWLEWLKNQKSPGNCATKPTKPTSATDEGGFVGFVAHSGRYIQKNNDVESFSKVPASQAPASDNWCWPHSNVMNSVEIGILIVRLAKFLDRGLTLEEAERMADHLVQRDRQEGDRRTCLECSHLGGLGPWRCGNWQRADIAVDSKSNGLSRTIVNALQRCPGFEAGIKVRP